ncbi:MAG: hypothetical protein AMXMBFR7_19420 [Planctomycetota bacterium]
MYAPRFTGLLVCVSLAACACSATDWYVSPSGTAGGTGTSGSPFRQIRQALPVVGPGDTVHVADGSYLGFTMEDIDGGNGAPITIKATGSNAVVVKTTDRSDNRDTIFITFCTYIVIDGLRSFDANRAAIRIDAGHHITIRNCVLGDNERWGILTGFSDDLLIENNTAYGSRVEHGIYVANSGDRPVVRGNVIYGNNANGLHMNGDLEQGGDGIISNALVEDNVIYNNGLGGGGSGINCDGVTDSVIRNNLIYNAHHAGISLYQIDGGSPSHRNTVVNNTLDLADNGKWCLQIHDGSTNTVVFNNVFVTRHATRGSIHFNGAGNLTGLVCDYNILRTGSRAVTTNDDSTYLSLSQWQALGYDTHSTAGTAAGLFVDPDNGNYALLTDSAAKDTGVASLGGKNAPADDRLGAARPQGSGYDLGSLEAAGTPPVNTPPTISAIADRNINEDASTGSIAFTIGDAQTAAAALTVTRASSNTTLLPLSAIVFGGSGANRTVTLTPAANRSGASTVTLTVSDGALTAQSVFVLTVNAVNDPPTVSIVLPSEQPHYADPGDPVSFSSTGSDLEGAVTYLWDFGDGTGSTSAAPAHAFAEPGVYSVRVTVTDSGSLTAFDTVTVIVGGGNLGSFKVVQLQYSLAFSKKARFGADVDTLTLSALLDPGALWDAGLASAVLNGAVLRLRCGGLEFESGLPSSVSSKKIAWTVPKTARPAFGATYQPVTGALTVQLKNADLAAAFAALGAVDGNAIKQALVLLDLEIELEAGASIWTGVSQLGTRYDCARAGSTGIGRYRFGQSAYTLPQGYLGLDSAQFSYKATGAAGPQERFVCSLAFVSAAGVDFDPTADGLALTLGDYEPVWAPGAFTRGPDGLSFSYRRSREAPPGLAQVSILGARGSIKLTSDWLPAGTFGLPAPLPGAPAGVPIVLGLQSGATDATILTRLFLTGKVYKR